MTDISAFRINGTVDTKNTALSNLTAMTTACACWVSYDVTTSLWCVIINKPGTSKFAFNNSNIIGNINISGTGIDQLYNNVEIQYPLSDIKSTTDYQNLSLDPSYWNPNELYKLLSIQTNLINNPVQAQYIGQIQLKQNRIDKIVTFTTDYTALGLKAGDLIDLTVDMYGYTNKMFRIISIVENDSTEGAITLDITALEYDAAVYDSTGLTYTARASANGITPITNNSQAIASNLAASNPTVKIFTTDTIWITTTGTHAGEYVYFATDTDTQFYQRSRSLFYCNTDGYPNAVRAPYNGYYSVSYYCNFGVDFGGAIDPNILPATIRKQMSLYIEKNGQAISLGNNYVTTIAKGEDPFADLNATGRFYAAIGDLIVFSVALKSDLNGGPQSTVTITGELKYTGVN
jgi:hypothetical protein